LPVEETDLIRATRIYETILATTDDFAYIFDPKGRFLYANAPLLKVWAKSLDQVVGKTCHDLGYPTWHADLHMREIEEVVRTKAGIRGEVPFTGDSGISGIYDYIFKPVLNAEGEVDVIVGTTRDVTDRKRDEEKLKSFQSELEARAVELQTALEAKSNSEQRYRFLADSVPQIAWTARPDGHLNYYNQKWFEYAGTTPEEMDKVGWTFFVHPDDLPNAGKIWQESLDTGCDYEVEFRLKRASDQTYRWHLVRALPMRDANGKVIQWFGTCTDIDDTRLLQGKAEFLSHLSQRLSTVSDASEINRIATEEIGLFLKAQRCYCFEILPGTDRVRVLPDWHGKDEASLAGEYSLLAFGTPEFIQALGSGSFSVEDVRAHPWTKDFASSYEPLHLAAYAFAPFIRDKRWVASIGVGSNLPRRWTNDEINLLENAAVRVWPLIERANLEGALRLGEEAQSRIAAIVESSDDAIISKTLGGIITSWNQGAERIFGYTAREAIGRHIFLLIPPELQKEEPQIIARLKRGERIEHYETIRVGKDGRRIDISLSVSPIKDRTGKISGASKIARDITEEKKRQLALKESEARFRTLSDSAPLLIWETGTDQLRNYFNRTWLDFVGRKLEQEMGIGWTEGIHPADRENCLNAYTNSFAAHAGFEIEYRLRHHTGDYRWILDKGSPRFGPTGAFLGYIGASADINEAVQARQSATERREELERLVNERTTSLQEAVLQMEEFSYSVSHDLRAPLRAMQGYAAALLEDYRGRALDAEGEDYLQRIITAGLRMDRLTRDVLVYSKIPRAAMQLHEIALDNLVFDIVQQYRQAKPGQADIVVETPLLSVVGNESFLVQAISNLVDNAVKFAAKNRQLSIRLRTEPHQGQVRLWVEDNGIGLKPEHQPRIWGMFERVHPQQMYEGTGIGLAIVRKTIERMHGTMGVESDGITGSKFWIQLPGH
jgi:PAS domain S-box-containing protein